MTTRLLQGRGAQHRVSGTAARSPAARGRGAVRVQCAGKAEQDPLLLRVARGEAAERTPVWLMRQAGRYMKAFREYSDKYPFRMRSETPDIAIELSLQPWRAFKPDGVILFSDILTPLPALGVEFDVVKGKGPVIPTAIRSMEQVKALRPMEDPSSSLPFIKPILSALRQEVAGQSTVLGFVGTPWTLAAYAIEGGSTKECKESKQMMYHRPDVLHAFLDHLTHALVAYVCYQIESGAQVVQLFDSWAHHLTPAQFAEFSMPYAERIVKAVRAKHPHVPIIFHGNGSTGKLELMRSTCADVVGLDWATDMATARAVCGPDVKVAGNVDPMILFAPHDVIKAEVRKCLLAAGPSGHILNVGHGVAQGTPEEAVGLFCDLARESGALFKANGVAPQAAAAKKLVSV